MSIYDGVFEKADSFDGVGAGGQQGAVSVVAHKVYTGFDPSAVDGKMLITGSTGMVDSSAQTFDPTTQASYKEGALVVDQSGEFIYLDRDLQAVGTFEFYVAFDDADITNAVPITPGTVIQREFKRFRVVAVQTEFNNAEIDGGIMGEYDNAIPFTFRAVIGFDFAVHARPDMRVKIIGVSDAVRFNGVTVQALNNFIRYINRSTIAGILGAPQSDRDLEPSIFSGFSSRALVITDPWQNGGDGISSAQTEFPGIVGVTGDSDIHGFSAAVYLTASAAQAGAVLGYYLVAHLDNLEPIGLNTTPYQIDLDGPNVIILAQAIGTAVAAGPTKILEVSRVQIPASYNVSLCVSSNGVNVAPATASFETVYSRWLIGMTQVQEGPWL